MAHACNIEQYVFLQIYFTISWDEIFSTRRAQGSLMHHKRCIALTSKVGENYVYWKDALEPLKETTQI